MSAVLHRGGERPVAWREIERGSLQQNTGLDRDHGVGGKRLVERSPQRRSQPTGDGGRLVAPLPHGHGTGLQPGWPQWRRDAGHRAGEHVGGDAEVCGAAPVQGVRAGQRQHRRLLGRGDQAVEHDGVAEEGVRVDLLEAPRAELVGGDLAGHGQQRRAVGGRVVDAAEQVGGAWPGCPHAHAEPSGELGPGRGHQGAGALVPDGDQPHAVLLAERVHDRIQRLGRQRECHRRARLRHGRHQQVGHAAAAANLGPQVGVRLHRTLPLHDGLWARWTVATPAVSGHHRWPANPARRSSSLISSGPW